MSRYYAHSDKGAAKLGRIIRAPQNGIAPTAKNRPESKRLGYIRIFNLLYGTYSCSHSHKTLQGFVAGRLETNKRPQKLKEFNKNKIPYQRHQALFFALTMLNHRARRTLPTMAKIRNNAMRSKYQNMLRAECHSAKAS